MFISLSVEIYEFERDCNVGGVNENLLLNDHVHTWRDYLVPKKCLIEILLCNILLKMHKKVPMMSILQQMTLLSN